MSVSIIMTIINIFKLKEIKKLLIFLQKCAKFVIFHRMLIKNIDILTKFTDSSEPLPTRHLNNSIFTTITAKINIEMWRYIDVLWTSEFHCNQLFTRRRHTEKKETYRQKGRQTVLDIWDSNTRDI